MARSQPVLCLIHTLRSSLWLSVYLPWPSAVPSTAQHSLAAGQKSKVFWGQNVSRTGNVIAENSSGVFSGTEVPMDSGDGSAGREVGFLQSFLCWLPKLDNHCSSISRNEIKKVLMHHAQRCKKHQKKATDTFLVNWGSACLFYGNGEEFWRLQSTQNVVFVPPLKRWIAWAGEKAQAGRFSIYLANWTCNHILSQVLCRELMEGVN